jgi:YesN/AraC family two-component response regulator
VHRIKLLVIPILLFIFLPGTWAEKTVQKGVKYPTSTTSSSLAISKIEKEESLAVSSLLESIDSDDTVIKSQESTDKNTSSKEMNSTGKSSFVGKKKLSKKHASFKFEFSRYRKYLTNAFLLLIAFLFVAMIAFSWTRKKDSKRFMTTGRLSIMDKEVQRACNYIEENFDKQELSVQLICNDLVTGEAFLNALFMKELGISVEEFINQVRVNRLKIMLDQDPGVSMGELSSRSGFQNEKQMLDNFSGITGTKIEDYRKSMQTRMPV